MYNVMFKLDSDVPVSTPRTPKERVAEGLFKTVCEDIRNLMREGSCTIAYARFYCDKVLVKEVEFEYGMPEKAITHNHHPKPEAR